MRCIPSLLLTIWAASRVVGAAPDGDDGGSGSDEGTEVWVTPHDSYSSSVGVLGCKVDTNRVAYWPGAVDCDRVCVEVRHGGRAVRLLRIDQSQGAHDVSYDAWNLLYTGYAATERPAAGGAVAMRYVDVDAAACADLLHTDGQKLPLSAANSMNFLAACLARPGSWVARNYVLYNVLDSACAWGRDEVCALDWPAANQASCPSGLGDNAPLTSAPVYNVKYPSGQTVVASSGEVVDAQNTGAGCTATPVSLLNLVFSMVALSSWLAILIM
ncbi:hypothetical protein GGR52DRAFT_555325 [Hypoxylon sp. FL1284]|nr:hypothetical protein GGR52DRAFT_555325 [Hypoxylon sp. FL1284]